jgi:hypothetical protein
MVQQIWLQQAEIHSFHFHLAYKLEVIHLNWSNFSYASLSQKSVTVKHQAVAVPQNEGQAFLGVINWQYICKRKI